MRGVSLEIEQGAFYTLLGPSGCGKTTILRCVAGLEHPDAGEIAIGGEVVFSAERGIWVPPHQRNIGMVFQSYAIWPHMTVFENVAFPLRHKRPRLPRAEIRERVAKALLLVHLDGLEDRPAPYLSGGQQQRLALGARARRRAARAAARRAALQPRCEAARGDAARDPPGGGAPGRHHALRHARADRGAHHVGRDGGDA